MYKLNKNELKKVIGGLTIAELALLSSLAATMLQSGFKDEVVSAFLTFVFSDALQNASIEDSNVIAIGNNNTPEEIIGIKLIKLDFTDGTRVLATEKHFKAINGGVIASV